MASLLAASMKPQVLTTARSAPSGGAVRLGHERVARLVHQIEHLLGVDQILGAAERDHGKGFFHRSVFLKIRLYAPERAADLLRGKAAAV